MIVNDRISEYIELLTDENSEYTENIRKRALEDGVPIIRRAGESFMKTLLSMNKVNDILELGTAVAYSALVMAESCDAKITTIENHPKRIEKAKFNIANSNYSDRINLIEGDVTSVLQDLISEGKKYDFIFVDAAKAQYVNWLPSLKLLLRDRAVLFSDNILQDGSIVESRFAIDRRYRTIHQRLRQYLHMLTHDRDFTSSIIPVGDGVALSVFNGRINE